MNGLTSIFWKEIYHAKDSSNFQFRFDNFRGGGVAFLYHKRVEGEQNAMGRMYLVTEEQFHEIVKQENGLMEYKNIIDIQKLKQQKGLTVK